MASREAHEIHGCWHHAGECLQYPKLHCLLWWVHPVHLNTLLRSKYVPQYSVYHLVHSVIAPLCS